MASCTFFGHKDCPGQIRSILTDTLENLIIQHGVNMFYVGSQGIFDRIVHSVLRQLKERYPHIDYAVVLAYLPSEHPSENTPNDPDTIFPEGIESVPRRFAISWRNRWMIVQSDYVVVYITHSWGGAAQFAEKAAKAGKHVLNRPVVKSN